ncbi:MAG: class I SAM-dependent methyltransferase [Formosa sp.]|nr:class I SAM-dependent methyltransferase [Formosa sp.]MDG1373999.1 class I SAM-dependent methyltransferase [Flavobacteriaceae bacterium]
MVTQLENIASFIGISLGIIGLDFSEEMLNKAKEKIHDKRVTFKKADLN